jgi:hypothetical protein
MRNVSEIHDQIEKLQKQAREIKVQGIDNTASVLVMMDAFGITLKELGDVKSRGPRVGVRGKVQKAPACSTPKNRKTTSAIPVKYRRPTGETWNGCGLTL